MIRAIPRKNTASLSTIGVGGICEEFISCKDQKDIIESIQYAHKNNKNIFFLGAGSNVFFDDAQLRGIVIKLDNTGIKKLSETVKKVEYEVEAGESWDKFVKHTVQKKIYGLENLSGVPGSIGGAVVQNIGAYGKEVKEFVTSVKVFDLKKKKIIVLSKKQCLFAYRYSIFKKLPERYCILSVRFTIYKKKKVYIEYAALKKKFKDRQATPELIRKTILSMRREKFGSVEGYGTCGSFFKNPIISKKLAKKIKYRYPDIPLFSEQEKIKIPLAFVLDKIFKLRGFTINNVKLSEKNPIVLVNMGNARAKDILAMSNFVEKNVFKKFNIRIEREAVFIKNSKLHK